MGSTASENASVVLGLEKAPKERIQWRRLCRGRQGTGVTWCVMRSEMLWEQGVGQFGLWTGRTVP